MFHASRAQHRAKSKFHAATVNNDLITEPEKLPVSKIAKLSGSAQIIEWFQVEGCREWFLDGNSNHALIESGVEDSILALISIVTEERDGEKGSPRAGEQISAAKLLMEMAGYGKAKADEADAGMTDAEADKLIADKMKKMGKLAAVVK